MREEFGFERTECACKECAINCRFMPGFLIPSDLDRMVPAGEDPFRWAERNLLASPGALVMSSTTGATARIQTLVPATRDGACIHLRDGLCTIHEVSPFGCAFFDCGPERGTLAKDGLMAVMDAWQEDSLYAQLWKYLAAQKRVQKSADILRARMREAYTAELNELR